MCIPLRVILVVAVVCSYRDQNRFAGIDVLIDVHKNCYLDASICIQRLQLCYSFGHPSFRNTYF